MFNIASIKTINNQSVDKDVKILFPEYIFRTGDSNCLYTPYPTPDNLKVATIIGDFDFSYFSLAKTLIAKNINIYVAIAGATVGTYIKFGVYKGIRTLNTDYELQLIIGGNAGVTVGLQTISTGDMTFLAGEYFLGIVTDGNNQLASTSMPPVVAAQGALGSASGVSFSDGSKTYTELPISFFSLRKRDDNSFGYKNTGYRILIGT